MASINWQNNWGITPISDPQDLQNLRALYGLIYRTDAQVAEFIGDLIKIQVFHINRPIDMNLVSNIVVATVWDIFESAWNNEPKCSNGGLFQWIESIPSIFFFLQVVAEPDTRLQWNKTKFYWIKQTEQKILTTTCYGPVSSLGLANDQISYVYELLYPTIEEVLAVLRNGSSPACRHYQLENMFVSRENGIIKGNILFTRWLFWKSPDGSWSPNNPPSEPEYLGKYGGRDFWTTSPGCVNDFIILSINSTANSHAAALNAPKTTPTPQLQ